MNKLNPAKYNLHPRIKLLGKDNNIFILIDRKSRIIMKDGYRIVEIAKRISKIDAKKEIFVLSNAPICGKTQNFLSDKGIAVKVF